MSPPLAVKRCLVAFDFDHTLIDTNSDMCVRDLAPEDGKLPKHIQQLDHHDNSWIDYMAAIFAYLHAHGKRPDDLLACVRAQPLVAGMRKLLLFLEKTGCDVIMISDANSVFIEGLLHEVGLQHVVKRTYTNPASFDTEGCLRLRPYHEQDWCKESTTNMCKGHILSEYIAEQKVKGHEYDIVAFVGDGTYDLCPCLRLEAKDIAFPRLGFRLATAITRAGARVKAKVIPWKSGVDIMEALEVALRQDTS